jgi:hypothetical protein
MTDPRAERTATLTAAAKAKSQAKTMGAEHAIRTHYNTARPHRGLSLNIPIPLPERDRQHRPHWMPTGQSNAWGSWVSSATSKGPAET